MGRARSAPVYLVSYRPRPGCRPTFLDDGVGAKRRELVLAQAEILHEDVVVVLAEARSEPAHRSRRSGELGDDSGDDELAELAVLEAKEHLSSPVVLVGDDVGLRVDLAARHRGRLEPRLDLVRR